MLFRVKVRFRGTDTTYNKAEIMDLLTSTSGVAPIDVVMDVNGPQILFSSEFALLANALEDALLALEALFTTTTTTALEAKGLTLLPPLQFQAVRTIFIHRVSDIIAEQPITVIVKSINALNRSLTAISAHLIQQGESGRPTL